MTDIEDQLRSYVAATLRSQRPVELGEIMARPGHRLRRHLVGMAAMLLAVVVVAGTVVFARGRDHQHRVVVAPVPSSSTVTTTGACPAASLHVTSVSGEQLHPVWLPAGFVKAIGNEDQLGNGGNLGYTTSGTIGSADERRIELLRYKTDAPLSRLFDGTSRPVIVQRHSGIVSVTMFDENLRAVAWRTEPGTALVITGFKIPEADLLKVAENVQYKTGTPFTYPTAPDVVVTRERALNTLSGVRDDKRAALTSFGEIDAIVQHEASAINVTTLAPGVPVIEPVWVVWTPTLLLGSTTIPVTGIVVDAKSGVTLAKLGTADERELGSLTDRSIAGCRPPFGILTRSETQYIQPTATGPVDGLQSTWKLTTQGALDATSVATFADCELYDCDPSVPVWVNIQTALDGRFIVRSAGPRGAGDRTPVAPAGPSWTMSALDARTGPQATYLAGPGGAGGSPDSDLLALPDLAPEG